MHPSAQPPAKLFSRPTKPAKPATEVARQQDRAAAPSRPPSATIPIKAEQEPAVKVEQGRSLRNVGSNTALGAARQGDGAAAASKPKAKFDTKEYLQQLKRDLPSEAYKEVRLLST